MPQLPLIRSTQPESPPPLRLAAVATRDGAPAGRAETDPAAHQLTDRDLVRVGAAVTARTVAVPPWLSIAAARKIAALKAVQHLFVEHEGRLLGVIGGAALASVAPPHDRISAWMKPPAGYVDRTMTAAEALNRLTASGAKPTGGRDGSLDGFLILAAGPLVIGIVTREALERLLSRARAGARRARTPSARPVGRA